LRWYIAIFFSDLYRELTRLLLLFSNKTNIYSEIGKRFFVDLL